MYGSPFKLIDNESIKGRIVYAAFKGTGTWLMIAGCDKSGEVVITASREGEALYCIPLKGSNPDQKAFEPIEARNMRFAGPILDFTESLVIVPEMSSSLFGDPKHQKTLGTLVLHRNGYHICVGPSEPDCTERWLSLSKGRICAISGTVLTFPQWSATIAGPWPEPYQAFSFPTNGQA